MERREVFMVNDPALYVDFRTKRLADLAKHGEGKKQKGLPELHAKGLEYTLFAEGLYLWISRYSAGAELAVLKTSFEQEVIPSLLRCEAGLIDLDHLEDYFLSLWTVSIAESYNLSSETMDSIMAVLGGMDKDALLDRIVRSRSGSTNTLGRLRHAEIWLPLFEVFDLGEGHWGEHINYFLKQYYEGTKPVWWHDYHLKENAKFFGYWSFELAAIVKALNIADDAFANHIFYPRDFTGRPFLPTYLDSEEGEQAREIWDEMTKDHPDQDLSPDRIAKAQKQAEKAMRTFFAEAMKGDKGSAQKAEKSFESAKESFGFLVDSLGLNQKELSKNPEAAQALILQMMGQTFKVLDASKEGGKGEAEGLKPLFMEAYANMEKSGFTTQDILKDLPPELLDQFGGLSQEQVKVTLGEKMVGFSEAMKQLMADKTLSSLDMIMGMEKLAKDFGYVEPTPTPPDESGKPSVVTKKVSERLDKEMGETLKDRLTLELNFDDLWTRRDE